jgi:hypothetical protein
MINPSAAYSNIYDYGIALIESNDLDPLYVMLYEANLPRPTLSDYMLAYWCFYDTGTASWISEGPFWERLMGAGASKLFLRGGDRRHFRGDNATNAIRHLISKQQSPDEILGWLSSPQHTTLDLLMDKIQTLVGFGPTIAWKAADMLERFGYVTLSFQDTDPRLMSDTPRAGASSLFSQEMGRGPVGDPCRWAHQRLIDRLGEYLAPPTYNRYLSVLETETILCKWKHYLSGSYIIGTGTQAQLKGLQRRPDSPLAHRLKDAGHSAGLW